jgi:hypothetical protein
MEKGHGKRGLYISLTLHNLQLVPHIRSLNIDLNGGGYRLTCMKSCIAGILRGTLKVEVGPNSSLLTAYLVTRVPYDEGSHCCNYSHVM